MHISPSLRLGLLAVALGAAFVGPSSIRLGGAQAQSRERVLFVGAVNDRGEAVEGLTANDFVVREDGQRREVLTAERASEPLDIALLVDNSTAAADLVVPMREGLGRFVTDMAGPHQIAIFTLADRPTLLVDYTTDAERLAAGIGRIFSQQQSGATLIDGIVEVSRGLERREAARAVVVPVVTDGIEFTTRYSEDARRALSRAGAGLHAVTVGAFYASTETVERERLEVLDVVTRDSGGQRIRLLSSTAIGQALDKLAAELSSQYKVVYVRPESLIPPEETDVSAARPGVTMHAVPIRGQQRD